MGVVDFAVDKGLEKFEKVALTAEKRAARRNKMRRLIEDDTDIMARAAIQIDLLKDKDSTSQSSRFPSLEEAKRLLRRDN